MINLANCIIQKVARDILNVRGLSTSISPCVAQHRLDITVSYRATFLTITATLLYRIEDGAFNPYPANVENMVSS